MFQSYFLAWYQKLWISALPTPSHRAEQCGLKMIPRCTIYISILHKYHDIFRLNTSISMFRRWSRMVSVPTHNINTDFLKLRPGKDDIYAKSQYIWYILTLFWPFKSPNVMRMNHRSAPSILYLKQPSAVWRLRNNFIQIHVAVTLNVINAVCWVSVGNRPHVSTVVWLFIVWGCPQSGRRPEAPQQHLSEWDWAPPPPPPDRDEPPAQMTRLFPDQTQGE